MADNATELQKGSSENPEAARSWRQGGRPAAPCGEKRFPTSSLRGILKHDYDEKKARRERNDS